MVKLHKLTAVAAAAILAYTDPSALAAPVAGPGVPLSTAVASQDNATLADAANRVVQITGPQGLDKRAATNDELLDDYEPVPGSVRAIEMNNFGRAGVMTKPKRRINIINSTPYRWRRGYSHEYQMRDWDSSWPEYFEPGDGISVTTKSYGGHVRKDTGAEIVYHLEGTCKPMSFKVEYNPHRAGYPEVWIQFQEKLRTAHSPTNARINLGDNVNQGGVNFLLAGTEDDFLSVQGPAGWMQEQIADIGDFPLNELVIPRSHHAGMNKDVQGVGLVSVQTTLTQSRSPYDQMLIGGSRVLDFRPYRHTSGEFGEGHFTRVAGLHHGMIGIDLSDIIADVNRFNADHPGEMIIIDIHDTESWDGKEHKELKVWGGAKFHPLWENERVGLYRELKALQHRFELHPGARDVHKKPLNDFVGGKKPAVLIHCPDAWTKDKAFPGAAHGFVSNRNFPRTNFWSNTNEAHVLVAEQAATLADRKATRGGFIHDMQWLLTLRGAQNVLPIVSITKMARGAWGRLYDGVWPAADDEVYPNWITMDRIESEELKMLAMTMNKCLVARKCGKLGGKASGAPELKLPKCDDK